MKLRTDVPRKLALVREILRTERLAAVRLRGVDWFAWATGGGSDVVILTSETGVAEVLVTQTGAWIVTDVIEAERLRDEELSAEFKVWESPWQKRAMRETFVREAAEGGPVASDRPVGEEVALPAALVAAKRRLMPEEVDHYRQLGQDAAIAMTETLSQARPEWTEWDLAAAGARAMWARGMHPTLTLVAGAARVFKYRHPTATREKLGSHAMLVFCARREGLYANLTRWVSFQTPSLDDQRHLSACAHVEAAAWAASRPGARLDHVYAQIVETYREQGYPEEYLRHHQGGTTGYLSREVVATPDTPTVIDQNTALAWNPSLPGMKIEDTVLTTASGIEILTVDPSWPTFACEGRARPDIWVQP